MIYLFTDGIFDQFGGEKEKKIKRNTILEIIQSNISKPCAEQSEILQKIFKDWRGNLEQIDDVCVVGFKI
jgi:serine phosphatase RsbU (regulator of sigma subunit)